MPLSPSVVRPVYHNNFLRVRSYTFMLLSEHLFQIEAVADRAMKMGRHVYKLTQVIFVVDGAVAREFARVRVARQMAYSHVGIVLLKLHTGCSLNIVFFL